MFTNLDLLPQTREGLLTSPSDRLRVLNLNLVLLDETIIALENFFIYKNARAFDGHIGETSCQIRAYQIYLLITTVQKKYFLSEIDKLKELSKKLAMLKVAYQVKHHYREAYKTIEQFFNENNIICEINELTIHLTQLHLLSRFKSFDYFGDISINYEAICNDLKISKHMARRIVHVYQVNISKFSTQFIYSLLVKNNCPTIALFDEFLKLDEDGRFTLPCYWLMTILYKDMLKQKTPIVVNCERFVKNKYVDNVVLVFKIIEEEQFSYEYSELSNHDKGDLCFVLNGVSQHEDISSMLSKQEYAESFIKEGIEKVLFGNMAIHPQYSGKKLMKYQTAPFLTICEGFAHREVGKNLLMKLHHEQQDMSEYAKTVGTGKVKPELFYIRHILCDTIQNQINLVKIPYKEIRSIEKKFQTESTGSYATA